MVIKEKNGKLIIKLEKNENFSCENEFMEELFRSNDIEDIFNDLDVAGKLPNNADWVISVGNGGWNNDPPERVYYTTDNDIIAGLKARRVVWQKM